MAQSKKEALRNIDLGLQAVNEVVIIVQNSAIDAGGRTGGSLHKLEFIRSVLNSAKAYIQKE